MRLPREQAAALDRMVDSTGRRKQHLVSELLADQLAVGHLDISDTADADEVLTLDEAAALLRLPPEVVGARARARDLPGRLFGDEWRFARSAVLAWLACAACYDFHLTGPEDAPPLNPPQLVSVTI